MIVQLTQLFLSLSVCVSRNQSSVWPKVLQRTTCPPACLLRVPVNQTPLLGSAAPRAWPAFWLHCQHPLVASRGNTAEMNPQQSSALPPKYTDPVRESWLTYTYYILYIYYIFYFWNCAPPLACFFTHIIYFSYREVIWAGRPGTLISAKVYLATYFNLFYIY